MASQAKTPLMRQYHSIKSDVPDALLLFHLGDFYELFYDDAIVASRDLGITLTSRGKEKGEPVPMCGTPSDQHDNTAGMGCAWPAAFPGGSSVR